MIALQTNPSLPVTAPDTGLFTGLYRWLGQLGATPTRVSDGTNAATEAPTIQIRQRTTLWVSQPYGCHVECTEGTLWLTFDGEQQDLILERGESHTCTKKSRLAIHAIAAGTVRLS